MERVKSLKLDKYVAMKIVNKVVISNRSNYLKLLDRLHDMYEQLDNDYISSSLASTTSNSNWTGVLMDFCCLCSPELRVVSWRERSAVQCKLTRNAMKGLKVWTGIT